MDFVSIYIIPIGAVIGAISWFWIIKKEEILDEVNSGANKTYGSFWYFVGKFIYVPIALLTDLSSVIVVQLSIKTLKTLSNLREGIASLDQNAKRDDAAK